MKEAPFAILHDGVIQKISGQIPGTVYLEIECDYLRRRFSAKGNSFILALSDCARISFFTEDQKCLESFSDIVAESLEMLSADTVEGTVVVYCSNGTLELRFEDCTVLLNETVKISADELENEARAYWDEWDESQMKSKTTHP